MDCWSTVPTQIDGSTCTELMKAMLIVLSTKEVVIGSMLSSDQLCPKLGGITRQKRRKETYPWLHNSTGPCIFHRYQLRKHWCIIIPGRHISHLPYAYFIWQKSVTLPSTFSLHTHFSSTGTRDHKGLEKGQNMKEEKIKWCSFRYIHT